MGHVKIMLSHLGVGAELRKPGSHTVKRNHHQKEKEEVGASKHARWEIIKDQLVKPMGDETLWVHRSGAIICPKSILPDSQGTHDTEDALGGDNSNQEQVNDSEVEVTDKGPTAKIPEPNDRHGSNIKQHHDRVQDQYDIAQAGKRWTH